MARRPAAILGHIFGGRDDAQVLAAGQDQAHPPYVASPTDRPSATRRVAVNLPRLYREAYSGTWRLARPCVCGHGDLPGGFHRTDCPRHRRLP